MYQKRNRMPRSWPLPRKGSKYVALPRHNVRRGIPLLIVLRDILKIVKDRREAKKLLNAEKVRINEKVVKEVRFGLIFLDILKIGEKSYEMGFKNKKFSVNETKKEEKIAKIIGKKKLKKGVQINLNDGRNYFTKENFSVGDSALLDLKEKKIKKILPLKEKAEVIIIGGKHIGKEGKIEKIYPEKKSAFVKAAEGNLLIELNNLLVVK